MKRKLLVLVASVMPMLLLTSVVAAQPQRGGLLTDIPVVGEAEVGEGPLAGLEGDFDGTLSITELRQANGQLEARGLLNGTVTVNGEEVAVEDEEFDWTSLGLSTDGPGQSCPILFLELGPLHLDLLGLIVEIPDAIVVDVRAERGPGRLLGNLLCALLGILDRGDENAIERQLDRINELLQ